MSVKWRVRELRTDRPIGQWGRLLRGPRYIDLPFRVLLLIIAAVGLTPASLETSDPIYLVLQILAAVLTVSVCFVPLSAGVIGLVAFIVFALMFPEFVNPFQTVGEAAVAFVLSQLRMRLFLLFTLLLFGIVLIPTAFGVWGGDGESLISLAFGWLLAVVLGLVAAAIEKRIQSEITRREDLARTHERKLERMRLDVALDTHDTVSHGLAAEAAIVRMLGVEARLEGHSDSKLTELALVNAHTQQQLRVLLARLTDDPGGRPTIGAFKDEMLRASEMIRSATEAGGFDIGIHATNLPKTVPPNVLENALFTVKELATNIVKHSNGVGACVITLRGTFIDGEAWIEVESANPSLTLPERPPRSLSARIERTGGRVRFAHTEGKLRITASLPVRGEDTI